MESSFTILSLARELSQCVRVLDLEVLLDDRRHLGDVPRSTSWDGPVQRRVVEVFEEQVPGLLLSDTGNATRGPATLFQRIAF